MFNFFKRKPEPPLSTFVVHVLDEINAGLYHRPLKPTNPSMFTQLFSRDATEIGPCSWQINMHGNLRRRGDEVTLTRRERNILAEQWALFYKLEQSRHKKYKEQLRDWP